VLGWLMLNMNLPRKGYSRISRIAASVWLIPLSQTVTQESNPLPTRCSRVPHGRHGKCKSIFLTGKSSISRVCHVHLIRAVPRKVSRKYHKLIAERLKECLIDPTILLAYAKELEDTGFSKAADTIYRFEHGLMNYRAYPPKYLKKINTTNLLERVHKEIKRRTKKVGAFTNDASLLRLAVSILIDINEEWITGNRYLSVKSEMISLDTGAEITALQRHYHLE